MPCAKCAKKLLRENFYVYSIKYIYVTIINIFSRLRLGWHGLVTHPFWKGQVQHLTKELETSTEVRQSIRQSMHGSLRQSVNNSLRESVSDLARANSVYGQVHVTEIDTGRSQNVDRTDGHAGNMGTLGMTERPGIHLLLFSLPHFFSCFKSTKQVG